MLLSEMSELSAAIKSERLSSGMKGLKRVFYPNDDKAKINWAKNVGET